MAIHILYKLNNRRISSPDYVQVNGLFGNCKLTKIPTNKRQISLIQVKHTEIC